jgi:hypothetical protein
MALIPGMNVPAPEPLRRRYGLFDAAIGPLDLGEHGEGGGVRYVPVGCGSSIAYGVNCYGGQVAAPVKPIEGDDEEIETGVFVALSSMECTLVGYDQAELETKALRRLESGEMAAVESALWTGMDFEGNALGIRSLDDQAVAVPSGYEDGLITEVVGALERYAYTEQGYGGVAYIHAPVEVAAFAAEAGLIQQDGVRKVTPLGSVWSFGAYPSGQVIVTGQTTVWRAPRVHLATAFDRISNLELILAERAYAVSFDCFAGRATYDPLEVTSP